MADMSLVLSQKANTVSTTASHNERLHKYWPIALGIFSLVICSYPPNWAELSPWSHAMMRLANKFFHSNCISHSRYTKVLTNRGTQMGLFRHRLHRTCLLTTLLASTAAPVLPPLRRLFRHHFLPRIPHPFLPDALGPRLGGLRDHSRGILAAAACLNDMCVCGVFCSGDVFERAVER